MIERMIDSYWQREAALAYEERKRHVWEVFQREGWKPWMQYQVASKDLPWQSPLMTDLTNMEAGR